MKNRGPDSLQGWFIALVTCIISTLMYGCAGLSGMLFVASIKRYNADRNRASFPYILSYVLQAITGPFAGFFAKKFGLRIVVFLGSFLGFVGIATCFFAESIATVTILWGIVYGTGFGFSTLLLPAIVNDYFFKYRSMALGLCFLGCALGFFVFPPVFDRLYGEYGLSGTFLFLSGICLHCVPLSLLLKKPSFRKDNVHYPLKKDKKQNTFSSTSYITHNIEQDSISGSLETDTETDFTNKSDFRRFSLEFLWRQQSPLSSKSCKQCTLISKGTCYDDFDKKDMFSRSYENLRGSHYESLNNISSSSSQRPLIGDNLLKGNKHLLYLRNGNLIGKTNSCKNHDCYFFRECIFIKEFYSLPDSISKNEYTNNIVKEFRDANLKFPEIAKCYRKFSTIYFGTENASHALTPQVSLRCQLDSPVLSNGTYFEKHTYQYCSQQVGNTPANDYKPSISSINQTSVDGKLRAFPTLAETSNYDTQCTKKNASENTSTIFQDSSILRMYLNPVFIIMCIVNGLFNLKFNTLTTVIIDFSRDHHIDSIYEKYIMMCISFMGICGMLGFGWVTDGGYLTRSSFASMCLLIGSITVATLPQTTGFISLIIVLAIYCVTQASFVPLIPGIIAEYFEGDMQAVAVSACNVLCGPMYLIIPSLIGYFRDGKGSYDYIFYLLSVLALVNSISVFSVPFIARWRSRKILSR